VIGHSRGPLKVLLAPPLAVLDALLSAVDGNVGRCPLAAAWGRLPASLGRMKFDRHVAAGVLGGDTVQLISGVPKKCHCVRRVRDFMCGVRVAHPHSPGEPVGGPGAGRAGPATTVGPGMRKP
jgi:hypothetical protein